MPDVQVDVHTAGAADVYVYADPGQLEQVIVNLAVNARDAMPGGGRLRIAMEVLEVEQSNAERHGVSAGPHVAVMVQDTGTGMDTEVLARAFEPFFTTKGPQDGTGLGLSTVFAVVQQSGGFITVESELGVGTRFTIYLPTAAAPDQNRADARLAPVVAGGETVLLAEPDPDVARLLQKTLTSAGYVVLVGHTAVEALSVAERARAHPSSDRRAVDAWHARLGAGAGPRQPPSGAEGALCVRVSGHARDRLGAGQRPRRAAGEAIRTG